MDGIPNEGRSGVATGDLGDGSRGDRRTSRWGSGDVHVVWPVETTTQRFLDFQHDGLRLGDRLTGRGPLLDETRSNQVGYAHLECVVMRRITDVPSGLYRCSYLLHLASGDLIIEGLDPHGPGTYTFAVLGGHGTYADATGQATLTDSPDGTDMVIDLTP